MENSAYLDQLASEKTMQKPSDLDLQLFSKEDISGFSRRRVNY